MKVQIDFQYCYGIKKLEYKFKFDFSPKNVFAIYAPNGMMKTSFAKTFKDFSEKKETKDLAFPERQTIRDIKAEPELLPENVFVIESYNEEFELNKRSTLLANDKLRKEYDEVHKDIDETKEELLKKLKQLSGLSGRTNNIEKSIEKILGKPLLEFLSEQKSVLLSNKKDDSYKFHTVIYSKIFNDKVLKLLGNNEVRKSIQEYIERYDELIKQSPYLKREFTLYHAENVKEELTKNNFFKAGHSVNMFNGKEKKEFSTGEDLKNLLEEEKKKVLEDETLKSKFESIEQKLSANRESREFKDYLLDNKDILPELIDLDNFGKKIWIAYFVHERDLSLELINKYEKGQDAIRKLIKEANTEQTAWEQVIEVFNKRFVHMPFCLKVLNKEDVILKGDVATIEFIFKDKENEKAFNNEKDILKILSQGEKRALYILNIIFEVETRKKNNQDTLFIIDDIADSFDYKNKYAIIDYLLHVSETPNFFMIILTHNFDFYRTIMSRHLVLYSQCLMAMRTNERIQLVPAEYIKNPFLHWVKNLSNNKNLIASIPFLRNVIEYTLGEDNKDYKLLTHVLHYKMNEEDDDIPNTKEITVRHIKDIFKEYTKKSIDCPESSLDAKVIDIVFDVADDCLNTGEGVNFEDKIVLSIAIRLRAEKFMIAKITDKSRIKKIKSNQTWELLKEYKREFGNNKKEEGNIETLKRVNLITPGIIHINSFMYEPILDMGVYELRELYKEVKELEVTK